MGIIAGYADRVRETTPTVGTIAFAMAGAVQGYQSFSSAYTSGAKVPYTAADNAGNWEVGIGTFTSAGDSLSRDTVLASSNAGALVSFPGPTTWVWADLPAATIADMGRTIAIASGITPQ